MQIVLLTSKYFYIFISTLDVKKIVKTIHGNQGQLFVCGFDCYSSQILSSFKNEHQWIVRSLKIFLNHCSVTQWKIYNIIWKIAFLKRINGKIHKCEVAPVVFVFWHQWSLTVDNICYTIIFKCFYLNIHMKVYADWITAFQEHSAICQSFLIVWFS